MLSSLPFGSALAYSPRGRGDSAGDRLSRRVCYAIKQDTFLARRRVIPLALARLREQMTPEIADLLAPDVVFVPVPRSHPFAPRRRDVLWVPRRICEELAAAAHGLRWEPMLVRHSAVQRSASADRGMRPSPRAHYASMRVERRLREAPRRITLIDDIITKGSTFLAGASLLSEAFPAATVRAFALMRTEWNLTRIVDPVYGRVTYFPRQDTTRRTP